jgi:hypothetical protein
MRKRLRTRITFTLSRNLPGKKKTPLIGKRSENAREFTE